MTNLRIESDVPPSPVADLTGGGDEGVEGGGQESAEEPLLGDHLALERADRSRPYDGVRRSKRATKQHGGRMAG